MKYFKNPEWINKTLLQIKNYDSLQEDIFNDINYRLDGIISKKPEVSVIISAWNEEVNIIRCIDSLSKLETSIPFEIIVVNNNSTDRTDKSIKKLHVNNFFQPIQGCGPARQLGQEQAQGKYILLADADCLYPPKWLDLMLEQLKKDQVVCVYGRYSFLADSKWLRLKLSIYERMKDLMAEIRAWKRPYLNAYGISMGYLREAGLKAGYIQHNTWGDDGRIAFDMMEYGKIRQVKSAEARVWTGYRSLLRDGSITNAFITRVFKELLRLGDYFKKKKDHDTHKSANLPHSIDENFQLLKNKFKRRKK
ncbi:Glycosyl transferase family 2 [Marivirga sericea]|uniref:Glycosyl transferase family 2 n=1 Tax=Marivirga sericea TaxID=1028 RepID=A0A1X7KMB6_9BACT|nr:glycosyltransferase family A protein [Marivirga sericea]SMG41853.1 Glycosyl transferase family 2 [Marivirga sericea]